MVGFHELNLSEGKVIEDSNGLVSIGLELIEGALDQIVLRDLEVGVVLKRPLVASVFIESSRNVLFKNSVHSKRRSSEGS